MTSEHLQHLRCLRGEHDFYQWSLSPWNPHQYKCYWCGEPRPIVGVAPIDSSRDERIVRSLLEGTFRVD